VSEPVIGGALAAFQAEGDRALDALTKLAVHLNQAVARPFAITLVAGLRRRALAVCVRLRATGPTVCRHGTQRAEREDFGALRLRPGPTESKTLLSAVPVP
jgi:hypothetical protein